MLEILLHVIFAFCLFQGSHSLTVHQIMVKLPGWKQMKAITVDRVGTFYRIAPFTEKNSSSNSQVRFLFQLFRTKFILL